MRAAPLLLLALAVGHPTPATAAKKPAGPQIQVQGHRGARAMRPENTLPAFAYALEVGVDVLELDLVVTKDDRLVVMHDLHVDPVLCTGPGGAEVPPGTAVRSLTLAQLKAFDCGAKKNPRFPNQVPVPGTRVPTLEEVLDHVRTSKHPAARKVGFNIETKIEPAYPELSPSPDAFARRVVDVLRSRRMLPRAVLQSFDHRTLVAAKKHAPKLRVAMLISDNFPKLVPVARSLDAAIISPHHRWITKEAVAQLHRAGVQVIPWTANDEAAFARLIDLGVDGIITDDPAKLIAYLAKRGLR